MIKQPKRQKPISSADPVSAKSSRLTILCQLALSLTHRKGQGLCPWTPLEASRESVLRTTPPDRDSLDVFIKWF
jgi:hypothetical protein